MQFKCMMCIINPSGTIPYPQWAYGVTCWEVFSIGTNPYPGVENRDILQHLDEGLRLKQTILCPDQM